MAKSKTQQKQKQKQKAKVTKLVTPEEEFEALWEKEMDGAQYSLQMQDKLPSDFVTDKETGKRQGERTVPTGRTTQDLTRGVSEYIVLPPRSVWEDGDWGGQPGTVDGNLWIVSGEGTPGNWEKRRYTMPKDLAMLPLPPHPADWPKELRENKSTTTYGVGSWKPSPPPPPKPKAASSGLPTGTRALCVGCGHYFKIDSLVDHVKGDMCPAQQGDLVIFVMPCECCESVLDSAAVRDGFPKKINVKSNDEAKEEAKA